MTLMPKKQFTSFILKFIESNFMIFFDLTRLSPIMARSSTYKVTKRRLLGLFRIDNELSDFGM